jgi:hypothetical protein
VQALLPATLRPTGQLEMTNTCCSPINYVQAYDKGTHKPIFVGTSTGTTAQPQTANTPWNANGGSQTLGPGYCNQEADDFDVVYDPVDGVWVPRW